MSSSCGILIMTDMDTDPDPDLTVNFLILGNGKKPILAAMDHDVTEEYSYI